MYRETWRHFDFWLMGAVAVLTIFGIAMVRSAIAGNEELVELGLVSRQIIFACIGFVVLLLSAYIDYRFWSSVSKVLYGVVIILLALITLVGEALGGAARWLDVGFFLIQPSELAKIAVILVLADFLANNKHKSNGFNLVGRSLLLVSALVIWIFIQPDLSTSVTIMVIWFAMIWASGLHFKHLLVYAAGGLVASVAGFPFLEDYQKGRVLSFLFPDPNARYGNIYNVNQAMISIGAGGWFGQGYGQGSQVQLRFLKVRHTDFIFSALGEEFGFMGAILVIILLAFVVWRILRAARLAHDTFGAMICYGIATLIFFHTSVNIAMNLNLIPVTGLPLPFITYGGSNLLSTLLGIGLVQSVILRSKALDF